MKFSKSEKIISLLNQQSTDFNFFCFGILFLASAPFISCIFFLYSLYKGALKSKNIFKDKYNQVLILVSIVLILKSIFISLNQNQIYHLNTSLNWADLANWIPLFLCFLSLNYYLDSNAKREKVAKFLADQSVPDYDDSVIEEPENFVDNDAHNFAANRSSKDEMYDEAVALVARERRASTSFIQRHLKIGYNREATNIEKMEDLILYILFNGSLF